MKKKTKLTLTATTFAIFSLTITAHRLMPQECLQTPELRPVCGVADSSRDNTQPPSTVCQIPQTLPRGNSQSGTQNKPSSEASTELQIIEPISTETDPTQPTEKESADTIPLPDTQTDTKPTITPPTEAAAPQMGDTRVVDGKQQGYLLGFGWVDYMGENECIYEEGMYENGNKVGIMGGTTVGSDGNINRIIGIMD
ncbi:MAG: hypothetical protein PHE51_12610 [Eubacteriales bacterium]|nr:hypothetical protein [Eubacteriales bacterium]